MLHMSIPSTLATAFLLLAALHTQSPAAEPAAKAAPPADAAPWENISDEFFKKIETYDMPTTYLRRCVGMAVAPTGEIFVLTSKGNGVCMSKDHGATWTVVPGNNVTGRCETGFGFSIAHPYDGRLAFFCIDGTGGITLDGGATWRPFGKLLRMLEYADVDWSARNPQTLFGLLHEPFYTVLSTDGGNVWQQIYKDTEDPKTSKTALGKYYGILDAGTLLRAQREPAGIAMSTDAGKTWTEVAKYQVLGRRPVHYGKKVFWTTTEGVIVSENGRDWTLTGKGPEKAMFGPYFGNSEQEFMVVSDKAFSITCDGGKTWKDVAPAFVPPDGLRKGISPIGAFNYFGWDAKNNILYASSLGTSVYRLKLQP
jgi:photosystem II stability/assembly factor-like uncharacterized protein